MLNLPNVRVTDNLLTADLKERLIGVVSWMPVYFLNRKESHQSPHEFDLHWYYPVAFADDPNTADVEPDLRRLDDTLQPIVDCWDALKASLGRPVRLYECALSANAFGSEGRVHHDVPDPSARARHHTALVYCVKNWDVQWGGETLLFDDGGEIIGGVLPKPGRVLMMTGDPLHVGRPVSRMCTSDRRVLMFKFWSVDETAQPSHPHGS